MTQNFQIQARDSDEVVLESKDVLFVGVGRTPVCWYRAALPALYLGCDWCGVDDNVNFMTGIVRGGTTLPNFQDYKVIVWQQPRSQRAREMIRRLRRMGKIVLLDCDDYLEGVRKQKDHDFRDERTFSKKEMEQWQRTMSLSDGIIVTTDWLRDRYARFAPKAWTCKNGLDLARYHKHRAPHPGIVVGWAGATGHHMAFDGVFDALHRVMDEHKEVSFVSIGQGFSDHLAARGVSTQRIINLPFTSVELYPNGMTLFDIALAPARPTNWYRAKSALRYYEAAAVGAATLGDSLIYHEIQDGVTGYQIHSPDEWYDRLKLLVTDHRLRMQIQRNAKHVALTEFDMFARRTQWMHVFEEVINDREASA